MDIKWVFFDVGSTLADETEAFKHCVNDAIRGTDVTAEMVYAKCIEFAKQNRPGPRDCMIYYKLPRVEWHKEDEFPYPDAEEVLKYIRSRGYKIGIIGATVRLQGMVSAQKIEGMEQLNTIEVVHQWAEYLKKQKKCDLVILLSHLGFDGGSEQNPSDQILAANSRNIDFIIGGHSHTFLKEPVEVENLDGELVPIVQAGCKGIEIGDLKLY